MPKSLEELNKMKISDLKKYAKKIKVYLHKKLKKKPDIVEHIYNNQKYECPGCGEEWDFISRTAKAIRRGKEACPECGYHV